MVIKPQGVLNKFHDGTTGAVHANGRFKGGVHGDAADAANFGKGENVGKGVRVVPHAPKILEIADKVGRLGAAVGVDLKGGPASTNVGKESWVVENGHCGLAVKKDPGLWNDIGSLSEGKLGEGNCNTITSSETSAESMGRP